MTPEALLAAYGAHANDHGGDRSESCRTCRRYLAATREAFTRCGTEIPRALLLP